MFGATLDTAIGIVLVFLLLSTLLTILLEIISSALKLRAKALENQIARLIEDPDVQKRAWLTAGQFGADIKQTYGAKEIVSLAANSAAVAPAGAPPAPHITYTDVFNHPLVGGLSAKDRPSYVPASNFTAALLQQLGKLGNGADIASVSKAVGALPSSSLKETLSALLIQAGGQMEAFQRGIEAWYDSSMDRLSGDYKRFTQIITFVLGLSLAVAFNVDAVNVAQRLYSEPALRKTLEKVAETQTALPSVKPDPAAKPNTDKDAKSQMQLLVKAQSTLASSGPVGWSEFPPKSWLLSCIGWMLTALAGLLGAPFWFNALRGLVSIRNTGPKPASSTSSEA